MQPYYTIDFSASACLFEIRINDYPIITLNIEGQVASNIPINYAILKKGIQSITAIILPNNGEKTIHQKAELKFDIKLFDVTNDFSFVKQFGEYQSKPISESKKLPIITHSSNFVADVPYQLNAWQDGILLKNVKDIQFKLLNAYNKLSNLINEADYKTFSSLIKQRELNMATSMYLSKSESESRVAELIEDFRSGFKVMPIVTDSILQIYANGKVAALKKANGESALHLYNEKLQEELMLDITFFVPNGKTEFEVI